MGGAEGNNDNIDSQREIMVQDGLVIDRVINLTATEDLVQLHHLVSMSRPRKPFFAARQLYMEKDKDKGEDKGEER